MLTWKDRLTDAKERGHFETEDRGLSVHWISCAIGEHYPEMTEDELEESLRPAEYDLGIDFNRAVGKDDIDGAFKVYDEIQQLYTGMPETPITS